MASRVLSSLVIQCPLPLHTWRRLTAMLVDYLQTQYDRQTCVRLFRVLDGTSSTRKRRTQSPSSTRKGRTQSLSRSLLQYCITVHARARACNTLHVHTYINARSICTCKPSSRCNCSALGPQPELSPYAKRVHLAVFASDAYRQAPDRHACMRSFEMGGKLLSFVHLIPVSA